MKVAKETDSIALESDAWHLRTDVYTSAGIMAGLVLIKLTGILILDQLFAFGVAVMIMHAAYELTVRSFGTLTESPGSRMRREPDQRDPVRSCN